MRPYRIGIVGSHTNIDYPRSLLMGVQNTVEEAGHTLVAVGDLLPYHTRTNGDAYLRVSTSIASRLDLDVVIFPVGCFTAFLNGDNEQALKLLQSMDPRNTLVLDREVEGYRSITKDGTPGMRACMEHLIVERGLTRIAFVSGPAQSKGAQEREGVYFEAMAAHGLPTPPSLFARGSFGGDCDDVIERLIDDNPGLEAIACACDLIAYACYRVLRRRKLVVGQDIAVTGFDDHPRSRHMDPPLSTVHLTGYDYGCVAGREALRMAQGLPQRERVLNSTFVARASCGEDVRNEIEHFRQLLRQKPFPADAIVQIMLDSTLTMASARVTEHFRSCLGAFLAKVRRAYLSHLESPDRDDQLFSSHDLTELFGQGYRDDLSLEGFHTVAITLLEALHEESSAQDASWVIEQVSHLHLRIARLLSDAVQRDTLEWDRRGWVSFRIVDDALREDADPKAAYALMLREFDTLGAEGVDLYLLPEPVRFIGAGGIALSDVLKPLGSLSDGVVRVADDEGPITFQRMLSHALDGLEDVGACTVAGLMAGHELMGVALLRPGNLGIHAQVMAFLNTGSALKHLRTLATERELNQILNTSNLLLEHDSQHDEMTGLLNRRGFFNHAEILLSESASGPAAVMYLDLDGLKAINDTFGHDAGDEAIRETGRLLRSCIGERGILCRMGGDEFCALVLGDDAVVADVTRAVMRALETFNETSGAPYALNISVGSAAFEVGEGTAPDLSALMVEADSRLYHMKRAKKGLL